MAAEGKGGVGEGAPRGDRVDGAARVRPGSGAGILTARGSEEITGVTTRDGSVHVAVDHEKLAQYKVTKPIGK
jgi:hypothetical protein